MSEAKPTHGDIYERLGEIVERLDAVNHAIGNETSDGKGGTGLTGRMIRMEGRITDYDRIKERVVGAVVACSILVAAIWWIIKAKVASLFQVS